MAISTSDIPAMLEHLERQRVEMQADIVAQYEAMWARIAAEIKPPTPKQLAEAEAAHKRYLADLAKRERIAGATIKRMAKWDNEKRVAFIKAISDAYCADCGSDEGMGCDCEG